MAQFDTGFKKDEEEIVGMPFGHMDKSSVIQEARGLFNKSPIQIRKSAVVLTKLLLIINQGEQIGTREATEVFFAITKLFQSRDIMLRRLVYLAIKDLSSMAEDVIIVTSSLTKDMTASEGIYRASAIRALTTITDATMIQAIERYLKQAIVDRDPHVSTAALASATTLHKGNPEVVKRWVNEVQEACNSKDPMVQYHALSLMYQIKQRDRLAVAKLVTSMMRSSLRSPYATMMLIRYAARVMQEDQSPETQRQMYDFLEGCMRHKSEMVIYEAARTICALPHATARDLTPAVSVLQLFLSSPRATQRYAAVKTLSAVSLHHPSAVTPCNLDMENLITDSNRSIATLAITTLLKTGSEASVDRLMKQISSFMSEIPDEFKVVVVQAIQALCIKFPSKQMTMMSFLSSILRDEGGEEYKAAIVDSMIMIVYQVEEAKESGLAHLAEFIEDCEFTNLNTRVLHVLGKLGPKSKTPSKFIRYIYNRIILENATVRAAAVSVLAKFALNCPQLLPSIRTLLKTCLDDSDDEVRDRAVMYLWLLDDPSEKTKFYMDGELNVSLPAMEKKLTSYIEQPEAQPFDIEAVPAAPKKREATAMDNIMSTMQKPGAGVAPVEANGTPTPAAAAAFDTSESAADRLAAIPELEGVGNYCKSNRPVQLTESETEYMVTCTKHLFEHYMVLEYEVNNTLPDQQLDRVSMRVQLDDPEWTIAKIVPAPEIKYDNPQCIYVVLALPQDITNAIVTASNTLTFIIKDCDPETGEADEEGYDDEYTIEDLDVVLADNISPVHISSFQGSWEEMGQESEVTETFELDMSSVKECVAAVLKELGMQPCDRTDVVADDKTRHELLLGGVFRGIGRVLVRARMIYDQSSGVAMQFSVRAKNSEVAALIAESMG
eukprot:Clim_evm45s88 gene=Clim_evmTU45s88